MLIDVGNPARNLLLNGCLYTLLLLSLIACVPWGRLAAPRFSHLLRWLPVPADGLAMAYEVAMPERFDIRLDLALLLPRDAASFFRPSLIAFVAATALAGAACRGADQTRPQEDEPPVEAPTPWTPELAEELRAMGTVDQEVREGIGPETMKDTAFMGRMARTDTAQSRRLRELMDERGWPRTSEVGPEAAHAARAGELDMA